jgi:hypothetical protein
MLFPFRQNWRITPLPFSLALKNTVNTGVSFSTPSRSVANSKFFATAGLQGLTNLQGCHCGCQPKESSTWGARTTGPPIGPAPTHVHDYACNGSDGGAGLLLVGGAVLLACCFMGHERSPLR